MQIVRDYAGVAVAVPMEVRLLACFGSCSGDTPVRTHHHHLRVECIGIVDLPAPVDWECLECSVFVPGILAA